MADSRVVSEFASRSKINDFKPDENHISTIKQKGFKEKFSGKNILSVKQFKDGKYNHKISIHFSIKITYKLENTVFKIEMLWYKEAQYWMHKFKNRTQ